MPDGGGSTILDRAGPEPINKTSYVHNSFCWLHETHDGLGADTAVLLCPAFREDAVAAYRQFRLLADFLACSGYPTVRFDYPGTGDSGDLDVAAEPLTAWVQSVHGMANWLREVSGARRLVLCGLGLGATLAAITASQRRDIAALVLLAPVARGQAFIRQIEFEERLTGLTPSNLRHEMDGRLLPETTVAAIRSIDLRQVSLPPGCDVAVFAKSVSKTMEAAVESWKRDHALVTCASFVGLEPLQRPEFMCHEPPADFTGITKWLSQVVPAVAFGNRSLPIVAVLRQQEYEEHPVQFGPSGCLFGMICRARNPTEKIAVLIVSSSGTPRYGRARGMAAMARQYAAAGISSFRIDFAGVGDSRAPNDAETHVFLTDRQPDIAAAIDVLVERGYQRIAVQGLCSGAFHAFHAAIVDARISLLLLINLPLFEWKADFPIEHFQPHRRSQLYYFLKLQHPGIWSRLLNGKLGVGARLRIRSAKLGAYAGRWLPRRIGPNQMRSFAQSAAQILADRGTRTLIIMAQDEHGLTMLGEEFGPSRTPPGATLHVMEQIDHGLSSAAMRLQVSEAILQFLKVAAE